MHRRRSIRFFFDALAGIEYAWKEERNFRVHMIFGALTMLAAWLFQITAIEFLFVLTMIALVLMAEIFNTALEELCDKFQPEHDPHIGRIKDLSAGAVFITAAAALAIGCIIFLPHVLALFA